MTASPTNLVQLLEPSKVDMATLHARFDAEMNVVRSMLGLIPHCDPYLEIWPAGFRTYNVIAPNFLNMPQLMWGMAKAPKEQIGLMMYSSSRAAGCMYCAAHTCTFALRRGTSSAKVIAATTRDGSLSPAEAAVVEVGDALGRVPSPLTDAQRTALNAHFAPDVVEWLVLSAAMMGFLNKVMDALGVELEQAVVDEIGPLVEPTGWSTGKHEVKGPGGDGSPPPVDSLATKLSLVPHLPAALMRDMRVTRGIPPEWPDVGDFLNKLVGYDFPVFRSLNHARPIKAIGACLRMNLSATESELGLWLKYLAGLVFATHAGSAGIARACRTMAERRRQDAQAIFEAIEAFAAMETDFESAESIAQASAALESVKGLDQSGIHALVLAKAASSSPSTITPLVIEQHGRALSAAATIELVVWLGVLQMLYRLEHFYN